MKVSSAVVLLFVVGLLSGCVTARVSDDQWFHPGYEALAPSALEAAQLPAGYVLNEVTFPAPDGVKLYGIEVRGREDAPTVLYFGGDSFRIAQAGIPLAQRFATLGVNAFIVDYRGYGKSEGTPTIDGLQRDALTAYDTLRERIGADAPIVIHGFSLGSFIGFHAAQQRPVAAMVLESTATNVPDWARRFVPMMARGVVRIKMSDKLKSEDNVKRVSTFQKPLLLLVGSGDTITPPSMSKKLLEKSASRVKKMHVFEGSGHGNVMAHAEIPAVYGGFLASIATK